MNLIKVGAMPIEKLKKISAVIVINNKADFEDLLSSSDVPVFYDDQKLYSTTKNNITYVFYYNGIGSIKDWIKYSRSGCNETKNIRNR